MNINCHCHSCVASARHVDAKGSDNTSALNETGGVGKSFYYLDQVEVPKGDLDGKLEFCKVGESGKIIRSYTKCCGTLLNTAGGAEFPAGFRPFNRSCIKNSDGTRYSPRDVLNVHAKSAFEPKDVPEPKAATAAPKIYAGFIGGALCMKTGIATGVGQLMGDEAFFKAPSSVTEVVPITWSQPARTCSCECGKKN